MAVYSTRVYWTDWQTKAIHSANKMTGKDIQTVAQPLEHLMDLRIYTKKSVAGKWGLFVSYLIMSGEGGMKYPVGHL